MMNYLDVKIVGGDDAAPTHPHSWDPDRYLTYADERGRPFVELVARVGAEAPREVVDLGCGPGNLTGLLAERWPDARVIGLDSSPEMIEAARGLGQPVTYDVADLREWRPAAPVDVLVSNATLQWVPDHLELLPSLVGSGGARRLVRVPGAGQLRRAEPHDPARPGCGAAPTRRTRRRGGARLATTRPSTTTPWRRPAAWSTRGRRPTRTCSAGPTRSSPGCPAPAPGPRCRRCPDELRASFEAEYKARLAAAYPVRRRRHRPAAVPADLRRWPRDEAAPRPGRLPARR